MSALETGAKNTVGLVFTFFIVRLLDSLSTVVMNGERLSDKIDTWTGGSA